MQRILGSTRTNRQHLFASVATYGAWSARHVFEITRQFFLSSDPVSASGDAWYVVFDASVCFHYVVRESLCCSRLTNSEWHCTEVSMFYWMKSHTR